MSGVGLMEIAVVVLWAAVIAAIVLVPFLLVRQLGRNRREIERLERRVDDLEGRSRRDA